MYKHWTYGNRTLLVVAMTMMLLMAACGEGDDDGDAAGTVGTDEPDEQTDADEGEEPDDELAALIAAAQDEGSLTYYGSEPEPMIQNTIAAFEEKYGIPVQYTRLSTGELTARVAGEIEAGHLPADAVMAATEPFFDDNPDWWVPLTNEEVPGAEDYPEDFRGERWATMNVNLLGIVYNTEMVPAELTPEDYRDLIPIAEEVGDVAFADPYSTGNVVNLFKALVDHEDYGEEFFNELRAAGLEIAAGSGPTAQQIAAGANPAGFGTYGVFIGPLVDEGAPLAFVAGEDPATGSENNLAISATATNPNAARLWMHYRMSEEGATVMCQVGDTSSPLGDIEGCVGAPPDAYFSPDFSLFGDDDWLREHAHLVGASSSQ